MNRHFTSGMSLNVTLSDFPLVVLVTGWALEFSLLWQKPHNIRFTILVIFKCIVQYC